MERPSQNDPLDVVRDVKPLLTHAVALLYLLCTYLQAATKPNA